MDRLSSCYFCGDALDASLDEYPVVPEPHRTGDGTETVVLCADCHRKLDAVLETVTDAIEAGGSGSAGRRDRRGDPNRSEGRESAGADPPESSAEDEDPIESSLEGGEDVLRSVDGDGTPDPVGGDEVAGSSGANGQSEAGGSGASGADDESGGGDDKGADDGPSGGDDATASLTRLEYNKVMRLLQNREFPVDREGFVNVAANAYEFSHREVDQILDVAIQNDLIAEEGGKLVEPGD